jgi:general secretion pathway protein L
LRDTLYLQFREAAPDGRLAYALTGAQPGLGVVAEHATLDTILALAPGKRLVLFVPGADVRLASVQVPARQPQKVLQAAPYVLEDQLAEDVDTLHFAIGPRQADGSHPVAVTARTRMESWLAPLRAHNLRPDAVIPETLCLPMPEAGRWNALAEAGVIEKDRMSPTLAHGAAPGQITVRTGAFAGFTCAPDELNTYLQLADPENLIPLRLFVPRSVDADFTRLSRPVELLPGYGSGLEVLVRYFRPESSINLMQGLHSQQENWQRHVAPWRTAGAIAALWAVLALTQDALQTWRLGKELDAQEAQNLARFQGLFPGETKIVNLSVQAEQQGAALRGGERAPLFQMLGTLSASLSANPGLSLRSLQFREGALYLDLTGNDLQALEGLRSWYASRREALLEVQAANAGAQGVQIRLKLTLAT